MGTREKVKVLVTERALVQRVNRALDEYGVRLRKNRRPYLGGSKVGEWYVIDTDHGGIVHPFELEGVEGAFNGFDLDLEELGRELGTLHPYEALEGEQ